MIHQGKVLEQAHLQNFWDLQELEQPKNISHHCKKKKKKKLQKSLTEPALQQEALRWRGLCEFWQNYILIKESYGSSS